MKKNESIEHLLDKLASNNANFSVVSDPGWDDGVKGGRCITDFYRVIQFSRVLSREELKLVENILQEKYCPGWTGVSGYPVDEASAKYKFSTTWDSSD